MIHRKHYLDPGRRMPGSRDGSFAIPTSMSGSMPYPVVNPSWSPTPGLGEMTQEEKLSAITTAITAAAGAAGAVGSAINAPRLAREQRIAATAQAQLEAARSAERGESFRYAMKVAGGVGAIALALYVGRAILVRMRRK